MKKFISKNIDIILFIIAFVCGLIALSIYSTLSVKAYTFDFDSNGFLQFIGDDYYDYTDEMTDEPVVSSPANVPAGYKLAGWASRGESNRSRAYYIYVPNDTTSLQIYYRSNQDDFIVTSNTLSSGNLYSVVNLKTSSGTSVLGSSAGTGSHNDITFGQYYQITSFLPVVDQNGNVTIPPSMFNYNLNVTYDSYHHMYFNASTNTESDEVVDFYFFPSSLNLTSGSLSTLISDKYVTEVSASEAANLNSHGFGAVLNAAQDIHNAISDLTLGVIPKIVFYNTVASARNSVNLFNPDYYGLPYVKLTSSRFHDTSEFNGSITQTVMVNIESLANNHSGVYFYDNLCLLAVLNYDNRVFIARYDFSMQNLLSGALIPPNSTHNTITPTQQSVSDLQELADYLRYLAITNDGNDTIRDRNLIAYMQSIPWTSFINQGVYGGMQGFLPFLSSEFDTMFNGLFDKFYIPDIEDIEDKVDQDEAAFAAKFAWVNAVKSEVNFIVQTPLTSTGSAQYQLEPMSDLGISQRITVFDTDWIDDDIKDIIKIVFDVFGTIALVMYIFKTLPSTLGNMPSD